MTLKPQKAWAIVSKRSGKLLESSDERFLMFSSEPFISHEMFYEPEKRVAVRVLITPLPKRKIKKIKK